MDTTQYLEVSEIPSQVGGSLGIIATLLLGWKTLGLAICAGVTLGAAAGKLMPRWYQTTAEFTVIPYDDPTRVSMLGVTEGPGAAVPLFAHLLRSDQVIDEAVARHGLIQVYHAATKEQARLELVQHVAITTDRKAGIVQLKVQDRSPERVRQLALTIGEAAAARNAELWTAGGREYRRRLEAQRDEIRASLTAAEDAMQRFREREHIVDLPAQIKATVEQATRLEGVRIQKQSELRFARHYADHGSVDVQRFKADASDARVALRSLGKQLGGPLLAWERTPKLEVEYARLKRELDSKAANYELVVRQVEQLLIQETRPAGRTEVIAPPSVPQPYTRFSRTMLVLAGALLGLLFAGLPLLWARFWVGWSRLSGLASPRA